MLPTHCVVPYQDGRPSMLAVAFYPPIDAAWSAHTRYLPLGFIGFFGGLPRLDPYVPLPLGINFSYFLFFAVLAD
jgi:hypothetical protein